MSNYESEVIETLEIMTDELGTVPNKIDFPMWAYTLRTPIMSGDSVIRVAESTGYHDAVRELGYTTQRHIPRIYTDTNGYEVAWDLGNERAVHIHRLVAIAEYGFDAVANNDVVHHENENTWDNRPENLIPMSRSEHYRAHNLSEA